MIQISAIIASLTILLTGVAIEIGGVVVNGDDLIEDAKVVANYGNRWQLATALELYYSDHNHYPLHANSASMIGELFDEGYIMNEPLDISAFEYEPKNNGQEYNLQVLQ